MLQDLPLWSAVVQYKSQIPGRSLLLIIFKTYLDFEALFERTYVSRIINPICVVDC
jgi:hypothetical protein